MKLSRRGIGILLVVVVAVAAAVVLPRLAAQRGATPQPGTIVLDVGGQYRTRVTLPATVNWCPVSRIAQIEAISADTGFAVALRENDAITKRAYPVFAPMPGGELPKPSATAAFRWLRAKDTTVVIYRSVSGRVDIDSAGTTLSGSLQLKLFNAMGGDSLPVTARFAGLKVVAAAAGCT